MSKISKTAKASMGSGPAVAKSIIPDAELIRLLRIEVASGIYPSSQGTHAILRAYDALALELQAAQQAVVPHGAGAGAASGDGGTEPGLDPATQGQDSIGA